MIILTSITVSAQFREESNKKIDIRNSIANNQPSSLLLGFINPNNFSMSHSFDLSYTSLGNQGIALGIYTNSIFYKFNDQLNVQVDASLVNSPYNSFGPKFSEQVNGLYLSRVQVNYKPSDNMIFSIRFMNSPFGYYSPHNYFFSPFGSLNEFSETVPEN